MKRKKMMAVILAGTLALLPAAVNAENLNTGDIIEMESLSDEGNQVEEESDPVGGNNSVQDVLQQELSDLQELTSGEDYVENEAILVTESREDAEEAAEQYGGELLDYEFGVATIKFNDDIENVLEQASTDEISDYVIEPNYIAEIDAVDEGFSINSDSDEDQSEKQQWYWEKCNYSKIDGISGNGIKVAVIDTGADLDHSDLEDNIAAGTCVVTGSENTTGEDDHSHGTHVSGIIAADDDGTGITGIASRAELYVIKAANSRGSLTYADIIKGIQTAVDYDVDVINMSFSSTSSSDSLKSAIDNAVNNGIVCVASAGNNATSIKSYPAAYDNVIAVGASTISDTLSWYSNYGDWVDLTAPGGEGSTYTTSVYSDSLNDGFTTKNGTSQATPMVSAAAALILSSGKITSSGSERVADVREAILNTLNDNTYNYGSHSITGGLDIEAALSYEGSSTDPEETDNNPGSSDYSETTEKTETVNVAEDTYSITYTCTVSFDGRKHVSSEKVSSRSRNADIKISVSCNGKELPSSKYKVKFKNNKNAASGNSLKKPYFVVILKGSDFSKQAKRAVKTVCCDFVIEPCDLSTADLTYNKIDVTKTGEIKIKGLKYLSPGGKKVSLRSTGKNASYSVSLGENSNIILTGTGNFTGIKEL